MKTISKILLMITVMSIVAAVSAQSTESAEAVDSKIEKVITNRKYLPGKLEGESVEQLADFIVKGIAVIDASDESDKNKLEAIALGIADIIVLAHEEADALMKLIVAQVDDTNRMQVAVAVAALSGRDEKNSMVSAIMEQLGGPDTELGALAQEAIDNPLDILGMRLRVLIERIVFPAKSLSGSRLPGGARTLPLPPIRRPEGYGQGRKPPDKYRGQ